MTAGSTVRLVIDKGSAIGDTLCLRWTDHPPRLCGLPKGHRGTCLPVPGFPAPDISDSNPRWTAA